MVTDEQPQQERKDDLQHRVRLTTLPFSRSAPQIAMTSHSQDLQAQRSKPYVEKLRTSPRQSPAVPEVGSLDEEWGDGNCVAVAASQPRTIRTREIPFGNDCPDRSGSNQLSHTPQTDIEDGRSNQPPSSESRLEDAHSLGSFQPLVPRAPSTARSPSSIATASASETSGSLRQRRSRKAPRSSCQLSDSGDTIGYARRRIASGRSALRSHHPSIKPSRTAINSEVEVIVSAQRYCRSAAGGRGRALTGRCEQTAPSSRRANSQRRPRTRPPTRDAFRRER